MKKIMAIMLCAFFAVHAAAVTYPLLIIGKESIHASDSGWVGNVYTFTRVEGTARVYKYQNSWILELDNAAVAEVIDGSRNCIQFSGTSANESFEIRLSGQNHLFGGGISASKCRKLFVYGPGSLSETVTKDSQALSSSGNLSIENGAAVSIVQLKESGTRGSYNAIGAKGDISISASSVSVIHSGAVIGSGTIGCDGDLRIVGSLVSAYSDAPGYTSGGSALNGGGVYILGSSITLLGIRGIHAAKVEIDTSTLGILTDYEAILADNSLSIQNVQGLFVSERDAISTVNATFSPANTLEIIGNSKGDSSFSAIDMDYTSSSFVHAGGYTKLYAPNSDGICSRGGVRVTGGELSILDDPDWEDARPFFTAAFIANAAGSAVQTILSGEITLSNLENFFSHALVDAYIPLRTMQIPPARTTRGIKASAVSFEGGKTAILCKTDANGIVASGTASKTGGTVTVNGKSWPFARTVKYKVAFKANGGKLPKGKKMSAQTMTVGKSAKLRKNAFKRSGYVFDGWAKSKNGAIAYKNAQSVKNLSTNGKTVTLYAKWAKKYYKVAFYANGAYGKMATQKFTYGKSKKLAKNKFKRGKWTFEGWAKSQKNAWVGKVAYKDGKVVKNLVKNGKTLKLYAVWSLNIKVTLNPNGGTVAKNKLMLKAFRGWSGKFWLDTTWYCKDIYTPVRPGYLLKNPTYKWFSKKNGGLWPLELGFTKPTSITLYAQWKRDSHATQAESDSNSPPEAESTRFEACQQLDVQFYWYENGEWVSERLSFPYGQSLGTLPVPQLDNEVFLGWFTEKGGHGVRVTSETIADNTLPKVVYGCWKMILESTPLSPTGDAMGDPYR